MRVCVVGSGGREHALAHVLGRDAEVVVTPGNPGIPGSVATPPEEIDADLFVVGPEAPLVDGLADRLRSASRRVFGPGADGPRLEGSKAWMKEVLVKAGVPTARHGAFTDEAAALAFLDVMADLFVVKTDGLAAGKGVLVTEDRGEAADAVRSYLSGDAFGDAGRTVVIEEGLTGPELSLLAICDGRTAVPLAPAQDYKRIGDGDAGPNTGGMGAFTPAPLLNDTLAKEVMERIIEPTIKGLTADGTPYQGVLYAGLMVTEEGPKLIEYNCRFGDPECQPLMTRLETDALELLLATAEGRLDKVKPKWSKHAALTVVMAAKGYPGSYEKGTEIKGVEEAAAIDGITVFHAGTRRENGKLLAQGGRVLNVTAMAPSIKEAQEKAYAAVSKIDWPEGFCRTDIGWRAVER